jgi:hypothetical protein
MPQVFSSEKELPQYIAIRAAGEVPYISLPAGFPEDSQWQSWPQRLYTSLFESGCPVSPEQTAARIATALDGSSALFSSEIVLPHLKHRPHRRKQGAPKREVQVMQTLYSLLQSGSPGWKPAREFIATAVKMDSVTGYLDPDYAADFVFFETRGHYRNYLGDSGVHEEQCYLESPEIYTRTCLTPFVQNYLGAAAVTGMLEIRYRTSGSPFTPWAGISAFRLTSWGEYVMGKLEKIPVWEPRRVLSFSASGEIVSLEESSPQTKKLLESIGKEIAPGVYRTGKNQIIEAASTEAELQQIIDRLRSVAREPVPPLWQELFDSIHENVVQLTAASEYLIFQVPEHKRFLALLLEDTSLARIVIPAAGRRILVHRNDISRLQRQVQKRGLLIEITE